MSASRGLVLTVGIACTAAGACTDSEAVGYSARATRAYPKAGLYTPGNKLGFASDDDAGGDGASLAGLSDDEVHAFEDAITQGGAEDRCTRAEAPEGTPGTFVAAFTSASYAGFYEPENIGAVWIEDAQGGYVATPLVWAGIRGRSLFVWSARRCRGDDPDVVSSATLAEHGEHAARWDVRDHAGRVVPDGTYVLNIEVTEDEFNFGRRAEVPFDKGAVPFALTPPDSQSVVGLTMTYEPQ